jgi:SPP1 family predicted phage head-tail adaptor
MDIGRMNERITIQKTTVVVDSIGNHLNTWEDYFSCSTYASTYEAEEKSGEVTTEERTITFSVRYCSELKNISSTGFRVIFHGDVYNIASVDMMNYNRKEIKLLCRKEVRS